MPSSKTYSNVSGNGYTTYHSDGSSSKTYSNISGSGYTTYHSDGSSSKTYSNISGNGYTTYNSDGSSSKTYSNISGGGYTTYHSNGSTSKSLPGLSGVLSTFSSGGADIGSGSVPDAGAELLGSICWVIYIGIIIASIVSLIQLGKSAVLALIIMLTSVIVRLVLNAHFQTTFFVLWLHPFALLGWRLLTNAMWAHTNHNFLEPFGIFYITIGLIASYFLDCLESKAMFMYAGVSFFIMFFGRAYGSLVPFAICGILLIVAFLSTVVYIKLRPKFRH